MQIKSQGDFHNDTPMDFSFLSCPLFLFPAGDVQDAFEASNFLCWLSQCNSLLLVFLNQALLKILPLESCKMAA